MTGNKRVEFFFILVYHVRNVLFVWTFKDNVRIIKQKRFKNCPSGIPSGCRYKGDGWTHAACFHGSCIN